MPQAPRSNPRHEAQKAQEKESKRAKGAMSCAECRRYVHCSAIKYKNIGSHYSNILCRLKLKCDKVCTHYTYKQLVNTRDFRPFRVLRVSEEVALRYVDVEIQKVYITYYPMLFL